ncbi:MAG: DUF721 domain-containing protein [Armatimonadota bacterium]|nr:DUF721 domain-containing protein [bacterium]
MNRPLFRGGRLSRLGGVLNSSLDDLGIRQKVIEQQTISKWNEVVGPQIAASSMAEKIRDGVLYVCCKSSTWANELSFHKEHMMKKLNQTAGKKIITDIRFSARGYRKAVQQARKDSDSTKVKGLDSVKVDENEAEVAGKLASIAPAPELADKIQKAILASKRLEKVKREEPK